MESAPNPSIPRKRESTVSTLEFCCLLSGRRESNNFAIVLADLSQILDVVPDRTHSDAHDRQQGNELVGHGLEVHGLDVDNALAGEPHDQSLTAGDDGAETLELGAGLDVGGTGEEGAWTG